MQVGLELWRENRVGYTHILRTYTDTFETISIRSYARIVTMCGVNTTCRDAVWGAFILPGVLWASWICGFMFDMNLGGISVFTASHISPLLVSLVVFAFYERYGYFCSGPTVLGCSVFFSLCSLCFYFLEVSLTYPPARRLSLQPCPVSC